MAAMQPDPRNHAPTAQTGDKDASMPVALQDWVERAKNAYYSSTTFMDANYRKTWEDSIRAFNNQHSMDSKFNHPSFEKRSRIYRPKTRAVIRKTEAAGAAAFFSNMDVVSVAPDDTNNKAEVASADVMKQLLQYRLTKSIPWYQIVLGGLQDAQVTAACAHIYWEYKEAPQTVAAVVESYHEAAKGESVHPAQALGEQLDKAQQALELTAPALEGEALSQKEEADSEYPKQSRLPTGAVLGVSGTMISDEPSGETVTNFAAAPLPPKVLVDKPVIDLFPVENLRIDPGANWIDPINSSPYVIHLIPMYVLDIKDKMESGDWYAYSDATISAATEAKPDSTRIARQKDRDDPYGADARSVSDYEVVWVQRHIHRRDGMDWEFYMLGDQALLTDPAPLEESVLHGKRPYVLGTTVLETHRIFSSPVPQLSKGIQDEINEVANQRLDNVKFVLNKKFLVRRGKEADVQGLLRNVPGGVVMLDNPQEDVKELSWNDVTGSAFQEQQGLSMEMDELLGNFNPAQMMAVVGSNNPARNMAMLAGASGTLVEYALRTFVETFVQPVLRQLVLLEQAYETDKTIMKIAAKRAELFQRFGIDEVTDEMLRQEMTLTVNVGMGATDPMQKLNKFLTAMNSFTTMMAKPIPGANMKEIGKEIFGHLGYQDGARFFTVEDPQLLQMQQQIQQLQGVIGQLQHKLADKTMANQIAQQKIMVNAQTGLKKADISAQAGIQKTAINAQQHTQIAVLKEEGLNKRAVATHWRALHEHHNPSPVIPRTPGGRT